MARRTPDDRFVQLVEAATRVFIEQGYRRTQMADVAQALSVAKGTLYLYVESKEALFDLVVRCADRDDWREAPPRFPIPTPRPGATLRFVREELGRNRAAPALTKAVERKRPSPRDAATELEAIVRETYDQLARHRWGIKLLDRSARDHPDLADLWFAGAREGILGLLGSFLESRIRQGGLRTVPDVHAASRLVLETIAFWAVHRHWDRAPEPTPDAIARETVVQFVVNALALPREKE